MMRRFALWVGLLLTILCAGPALAQEPQVSVEFEREPVSVGQPFIVRVKVLVPTFMPKPPVWPTFEVAGLIVRLPERSSTPLSERVEGQTWSGIRRTYRIYPTRMGTIAIPPQKIVITYKDPDTNEDVRITQDMPEVFVVGVVPEGAEEMDPLILANQVTITQSWEAPEGTLKAGDAIVRKLDAQIQGASPLFIPPLLAEPAPDAPAVEQADPINPNAPEVPVAELAAYPQEPRVSETLDRGIMSGTRQDQVTYLPRTGGKATLPDITLSWFNLKTNTLETITLPGRSFEVEAPPAAKPSLDRDTVLKIIAGLLAAAAVLGVFRRYVWPRVTAIIEKRKAAYLASARHAHHLARDAAYEKDLNGVYSALYQLAERHAHRDAAVSHALEDLTRTIYDDHSDKSMVSHLWDNLIKALEWSGPPRFAAFQRRSKTPLPGLNPFTEQSHKAD